MGIKKPYYPAPKVVPVHGHIRHYSNGRIKLVRPHFRSMPRQY